MLEITAQLAAMTILQKVMPSLVISFCDNRAGLSALLRGFGKDPCNQSHPDLGMALGALQQVASTHGVGGFRQQHL